jgi:UDP-glucose 4-epimerase
VPEIINASKEAANIDVPYNFTINRTEDIAVCYANPNNT